MAHRRLEIKLNHAHRRVRRARIGITARGRDFEPGNGLVVCPATGAVRLRANYDGPEFQTSDSGAFQKLKLASFDVIDNNTPAGSWRPFGFDHADQFLAWEAAANGENTAGVGLITKTAWASDEGAAVGVFAFSAGNEQDGVLCDLGWGASANYLTGVSLRIYLDGRVELYHAGEYVGTRSLSGTAGYGRAAQEYVLITAERGRGRDLVLRTSKGGAATFRCEWVDPEDPDSHLMPADKFWVFFPKGMATVMVCPIRYDGKGYALTRPYELAEAPETGETLQPWVNSDRFAEVTNAHLVGHPQGGTAAYALMAEDGVAAFTPDGSARICRPKLTLNAGSSGRRTPWVWGVHAAYRERTASTASAEADLSPHLASAVRLDLPDSETGLTAEWDVADLPGLEAIAPSCLDVEGTPVRIALVDPEGVREDVVLLDGELETPDVFDSTSAATQRATMRAIDRLAASWSLKVREALPFDGLPMCRPVTDGISAALLILREMGFDDSQADLPDLGYRLPDVPPDGDSRSPTGEWNLSAQSGDLWGDVLRRLFDRAPNVVYGCRPLGGGAYGFKAVEPSDSDLPVATLYRTSAAAIGADPDLDDLDAQRLLYDRARSRRLPIEGNQARVTGYDPGLRAPIAAVKTWAASADPTTAPEDRFPGWIGKLRSVEYGDPGLTTLADCQRVCEALYDAIAAARSLDSYSAQLPCAEDGTPAWRGDVVACDDWLAKGEVRNVRTSAGRVERADESGRGDVPGQEAPPSRIADFSGGALLGYGGSAGWEIVQRAEHRAKGARRQRGWQGVEGVSPQKVLVLS